MALFSARQHFEHIKKTKANTQKKLQQAAII